MKHLLTLCLIPALCLLQLAAPSEKQYTISHTKGEWVNDLNGKGYVSQAIKNSNIPANIAFVCDSILNAQSYDINGQVGAALKAEEAAKLKADSSKIKKP